MQTAHMHTIHVSSYMNYEIIILISCLQLIYTNVITKKFKTLAKLFIPITLHITSMANKATTARNITLSWHLTYLTQNMAHNADMSLFTY